MQQVTLLAILDLSAAFDCVDHTILLQCLQVGAGLTDVVLQWISSFLLNARSRSPVTANCPRSSLCRSACHKEASSVRCCTFSTLLNCSPSSHSIICGCICTWSQVYVTTPALDAAAAVVRLSVAIADINDWMKASRPRLNPSKTQVMWLGTKQQLDKIIIKDIPLLSIVVTVVDLARNLGVNIDSQLSMDVHVAAVCRSGYYQLRQLRPLTRSLSTAAAAAERS